MVAITVYFLLSIAFYAFFAPFLGSDGYEHIAVGAYTFLALSVFFLYIRCTAINPADPGISKPCTGKMGEEGCVEEDSLVKQPVELSWRVFFCGCIVEEDCRRDHIINRQQGSQTNFRSFVHPIQIKQTLIAVGILPETNSDDALFCTLCNAEVRRFSKHCRSCDKCVDGFDHHCRVCKKTN